MRKVETKIPDESALYLRRLRTEQERKEGYVKSLVE